MKIGRLIIIGNSKNKSSNGAYKLLCKCDCGKIVEVEKGNLEKGTTVSCGCLQKELAKLQVEINSAKYKYNNFKDGTNLSQITRPDEQVRKNNTSGYTGVYKTRNGFEARLEFKGIKYRRFFKTFEEAVEGRKELKNMCLQSLKEGNPKHVNEIISTSAGSP